MTIAGAADVTIGMLKAKHLQKLAAEFSVNEKQLRQITEEIESRIAPAKAAIEKAAGVENVMKEKLIELVDKRWNGTFSLIGRRS